MTPLPPRRTAAFPRGRFTETLTYKTAALMLVAALTILLWLFALPRLAETTGLTPNRPGLVPAQAQVVSCPGDLDLAEACTVTYTRADGTLGSGPLLRTGLFDVSEGEHLPVLVDPGGRAVVAGWRPVVDATLLLALAATFTVFSINWWKRVLQHGDPRHDGGPGRADDRDRPLRG